MDDVVGAVMTLIDGDVIAYRCAAHRPYVLRDGLPYKDPETGKFVKRHATLEETLAKVDETINDILSETAFYAPSGKYQVYLTGEGNFRHDIAKSHPYKGNRTGEKPTFLEPVRFYMVEEYGAIVSYGEEADDVIAKEATRLNGKVVIASIDKDFLQVPAMHYQFAKRNWFNINEEDGLHMFYSQILTGDRVDNIVGIYGVGPAKAEKLLKDCKDEDDLWEAVVQAYDGDVDRVIENARLLWLRRKEDELWEPPEVRKQKVG